MSTKPFRYPIWVRGDLDGFFGLMVDNLVQVLLIITLCQLLVHLPDHLIYGRMLPGVAVSLLIGNLFYGLQAHYVARKTGNATCTALPYGINTPSVIAYAYFIMGPVYQTYKGSLGEAGAADLAWKAGLLACLVSGLIELTGSLYAETLRRVTPRAALLGVLAAIGITFIAADFAFRIFASPLVGLVPLAFLLLAYFAKYRFPGGLPGGFLAILFGSLIAWGMTLTGVEWFGGVKMSPGDLRAALAHIHWIQPVFVGDQLWKLLVEQPDLLLKFLTVSIPMGVINVLGSLQNIESAEAGGDRFHTGASLAVNGIGSTLAGLFGSCFPTTIYIGHPGWKALGARSGYSILNGIFFTAFFLFGLGPFLKALVPIEAGAAIVLYIGIIITAQAFQATPRDHAPAVALALFPALAALVVVYLGWFYDYPGVGVALPQVALHGVGPTVYLSGLLALTGANSGWFVVTLILAAVGAALIDHKYRAAAIWMGIGTVLTVIGAIHAYRLEGNLIREFFIWQQAPYVQLHTSQAAAMATQPATSSALAPAVAYRAFDIAIGYGLATILFGLVAWRSRGEKAGVEMPAVEPATDAAAPPPRDQRWT